MDNATGTNDSALQQLTSKRQRKSAQTSGKVYSEEDILGSVPRYLKDILIY